MTLALEENISPSENAPFGNRNDTQYLSWNIVTSNVQELSGLIAQELRSLINSRSRADVRVTNVLFIDEIRARLPSRVSYQVFRSNELNVTEQVRESNCVFDAAMITLEEHNGPVVIENTDSFQAITKYDIQFFALTVVFEFLK